MLGNFRQEAENRRQEAENRRQLEEARRVRFKNEGLAFLEEDGKDNYSREIFQTAFATFINYATQNDAQKFIAQIPTIQDKFDVLQNIGRGGNLCARVLFFVQNIDRKTSALKALFDAGIDYSFLKREDGTLFLYVEDAGTNLTLNYGYDISGVCLPYLKALLSSKNQDKFVEAVQDMHLGQTGFRHPERGIPVRPDFINIGIEAASGYLLGNPVDGRNILKPFYEDLMNPESVLGRYCNDMQDLVNENRAELQRIYELGDPKDLSIRERDELEVREKNDKTYETLKKGIGIFKEEIQEFPGLQNLAGATINGVIKDKKSIEELPLPEQVKDKLKRSYDSIIHPEKRKAYNKQEQVKLDRAKFARFGEPLNDNRGAQAAKNKTQSKQGTEVTNKNVVKGSKRL